MDQFGERTVLLYLEDESDLPLFEGNIYLGEVEEADQDWVSLRLLTDESGGLIQDSKVVTVTHDHLLPLRPSPPLHLLYFYYLSPPYQPQMIVASNFVNKTRLTSPLTSTSRSALGSGIYGLYLLRAEEAREMKFEPSQEVRIINSSSPLFLLDKEHGISLSIASYTTNVFLDKMLETLFTEERTTPEEIIELVREYEITYLVRLWNFLLLRTENDLVDEEWLYQMLSLYLTDYCSESSFSDSITQQPLIPLPVNYILEGLGYDAVLASDYYNNGWDRGCLSLRYKEANTFYQGEAQV